MCDMSGQPAGLDLDENGDWLHTNDSIVRGTPRHEGTISKPTGKLRVMLHLSDIILQTTRYPNFVASAFSRSCFPMKQIKCIHKVFQKPKQSAPSGVKSNCDFLTLVTISKLNRKIYKLQR